MSKPNSVNAKKKKKDDTKVVKPRRPGKQNQAAWKELANPLSHQEWYIVHYLNTVGDPWMADPGGVPLMLNSGALRTVKYQINLSGTFTANASGFGFVCLAADGWTASLLPGGSSTRQRFASSGTQGYPIWYTSSVFAGTTIPAVGTVSGAGLNAYQQPVIDSSVVAGTDVRLVAAGLRTYPISASDTTSGEIMAVHTTESNTDAGGLYAKGWTDLYGLNSDLVQKQTAALPGWPSTHKMETIAVPTEAGAFEFYSVSATSGTYTFPASKMMHLVQGAASGQVIAWEAVLDYEATIGNTYRTDEVDVLTYANSPAEVGGALVSLDKTPAMAANRPVSYPNGRGPKASAHWIMNTRPQKLPALMDAAKQTANGNSSSALSSAVSSGLSYLWKQGRPYVKTLASYVPYVGNFLSKLL